MRVDNIIDFVRPVASDDGKLTESPQNQKSYPETSFGEVMGRITEKEVFAEINEENKEIAAETKKNIKKPVQQKKDAAEKDVDILTIELLQKNHDLPEKERITKDTLSGIRYVFGIEIKEEGDKAEKIKSKEKEKKTEEKKEKNKERCETLLLNNEASIQGIKNNIIPYPANHNFNESQNLKSEKKENSDELIAKTKETKKNKITEKDNDKKESSSKELLEKETKQEKNTSEFKDNFIKNENVIESRITKNTTSSISLTGEADEKMAKRIEHILKERTDSTRSNEQFEIKLALRPDDLGRVVLKINYDRETRTMQIDFKGDDKAMNALKTSSVIYDSVKNLGITVAGITFAKETDEEQNRKDKNEKDKKRKSNHFPEPRGNTISFFR